MIKKLSITLFLCLVAYIGWHALTYPTLIIPYPYIFNKVQYPEYEKLDVLIIGNEEALELNRYLPVLKKELSAHLKSEIVIENAATQNYGIHRAINRIKNLKKTPKVLIYLGNRSELYEQKFSNIDQKNISKNFKTFDDDKITSLIMSFPWISKFVYERYQQRFLLKSELMANKANLKADEKQKEFALSYMLYEKELKELINLCISKKIELVFVTSPINLEMPPKETCDNSEVGSLHRLQKEVESLIEQKQFKLAFPLATELPKAVPSNARSYYLLGIIQKNLGMYEEAKKSLYSKNAFDCAQLQTKVIYNKIAQKLAQSNRFYLIDFDAIVNNNFGRNTLFLTEELPQDIYYMMLIDELFINLKNIYRL